MNQSVTLEVFYPHSPERVWQALTDQRALAIWMLDNDFEPRIGHKFHFRQPIVPGFDPSELRGANRTIHCEVIELEPSKRLAYRWQEDQTDYSTIVTWTLIAVPEGTMLQLHHHQPDQTTAISPSAMFQRFAQRATPQEPMAIFDSVLDGKEADSPLTTIVVGMNDDSQSRQVLSSIFLTPVSSLELQAEWNHRLTMLNQELSANRGSD
jgi:uncharacterized protein YndB with AHSA1/START domain